MEINELNNDLQIDLNQLHEEWLRQPSLYMKYSEMASQAQRTRDQAKERIDVVSAECDMKIRSTPENYIGCPKTKDGLKPTEGWITSVIQGLQEYQKVNEEFHSANYVMNVLQGAVRAFDHRKKALEMEVQLWSMGYFSTPIEKCNGDCKPSIKNEAVAQASDNQREQLVQRRQRREASK
jgi:hypothetical protein